MSRTRRLHDGFDMNEDDDREDDFGDADLIHGYVDIDASADTNGGSAMAELDELLLEIPPESSHIVIPTELARRIVYEWLVDDESD